MGRPTTASRCAQERPILLAGHTIVVICERAENHAGQHQGPVKWPIRPAAPPAKE